MIKYLPDFALLVLLYFLCLPRWRRLGRRTVFLCTLFSVYLAAVLYLTLMPVLAQLPFITNHPYIPMELEPFRDLTHGYGDAVRQIVLNVLLTVPFGFLLPLIKKQNFFLVLLKALCLSLAIELLQPLLSGARSSDITDVITNTCGAALGYALQLPFRGLADRLFRKKPAV